MKKQNSNNDILVIEDYLDGKLNKQEEVQFQKKLESDTEFAKLYRFRLRIRNDLQKADHYKNIHQQVTSAIKNVKKEKQRKIVYAVAASIALLIVISGVLTLVNQKHKAPQIAIDEFDTSKVETYQPQMKEPESYAKTGRYDPDLGAKELSLSFAVENDSLVFSWQPVTECKSNLIVIMQESEKELFKKQVKLSSSRIELPRNELPAGKMVWYIEGFAARDSFELVEIR